MQEKKQAAETMARNIEMVFVKGGCYPMGDTFGVGDADEQPVHRVCVDSFYMGKFEVTQKQWSALMDSNPAEFKGENKPVETIEHSDAEKFISKLGKLTGKDYRLPTEAEWEYAARGGGKNVKYAGTSDSSELKKYAWYKANADNMTKPVGQLKPNSLGLYDMNGNVWEWCEDRYTSYRKAKGSNNYPLIDGSKQMIRGGGYAGEAIHVRAANRYNRRYKSKDIGFRLVLPANK